MLETVIAYYLLRSSYLAYARGQRPERSGFDLLLSPARLTDPATTKEGGIVSFNLATSVLHIDIFPVRHMC